MSNKQWEKFANKLLKGETIKEVRLATDQECENIGADYNRPFIICFNSGKLMFAYSDDEGNDIGALVVYNTKTQKEETLPRISIK